MIIIVIIILAIEQFVGYCITEYLSHKLWTRLSRWIPRFQIIRELVNLKEGNIEIQVQIYFGMQMFTIN